MPDAKITFSPSASCTSTNFYSSTNTWIRVTPLQGEDEVLLTGLAFLFLPEACLAASIR